MLLMVILFTWNPGWVAVSTAVWIVTIAYTLLVACIHGVVAHSLTSQQKGNLIIYPVFMGILFGVLVFIYLFLLLPAVNPDFMRPQ